jgi:hypothetical protein
LGNGQRNLWSFRSKSNQGMIRKICGLIYEKYSIGMWAPFLSTKWYLLSSLNASTSTIGINDKWLFYFWRLINSQNIKIKFFVNQPICFWLFWSWAFCELINFQKIVTHQLSLISIFDEASSIGQLLNFRFNIEFMITHS